MSGLSKASLTQTHWTLLPRTPSSLSPVPGVLPGRAPVPAGRAAAPDARGSAREVWSCCCPCRQHQCCIFHWIRLQTWQHVMGSRGLMDGAAINNPVGTNSGKRKGQPVKHHFEVWCYQGRTCHTTPKCTRSRNAALQYRYHSVQRVSGSRYDTIDTKMLSSCCRMPFGGSCR